MERRQIHLGHGSGGLLMQELIKKLLLKKLYNPILSSLEDSARLKINTKKIAFTTDSFVVSPIFFKGADIGKLAVCGTINDLVVSGAIPRYLSLSLIVEEGLDYSLLERIVESIATTAKKEKIMIVTGDFKVVDRGSCDKIFINTAGIGERIYDRLSLNLVDSADKVIISGTVGEHGLSIISGRKKSEGLDFGIKSDCTSLAGLIIPLLRKTQGIKFMRDPTRGGLSMVLNEIAQKGNFSIVVEEKAIPIKEKVKYACELLGLDPLYLANEGKVVLIVDKKDCNFVLRNLQNHPLGKDARIIGEVIRNTEKRVLLKTVSGGLRILEPPVEELIPRIC